MLIQTYRGKTRVMVLEDHHMVATKEARADLSAWLTANAAGRWRWTMGAKLKGDNRDFLAITFGDEADAHLFRLKYQKPGDVTVAEEGYTRYFLNGLGQYVEPEYLTERDRLKDALTFPGKGDYRGWERGKAGAMEWYSVDRNIAGYFVCWSANSEGERSNVSASKTKRIVMDRARKRAGTK